MNTRETFVEFERLRVVHGFEEAVRRMTGVEGSDPASCSRTRVAGTDETRPLTSSSARPFADQATGAIHGEKSIAEFEAWLASEEGLGAMDGPSLLQSFACRMRYRLNLAFLAGIDAQARHMAPRAQSDRSGDERCPECRSWLGVAKNADGNLICPNCKTTWAPGVGVERSGSANAGGMGREGSRSDSD